MNKFVHIFIVIISLKRVSYQLIVFISSQCETVFTNDINETCLNYKRVY